MPFSIDKAVAGAKREVAADGATQQRAGKVPKVSEMKAEPPRQVARASTSNAPVNICVYKITDNAGTGRQQRTPASNIYQAPKMH